MAAMKTAMKAAKPTIYEVDTSNGLQHVLFESPDGSIPKMWCKRFGIRFTGQVRKVNGFSTFTWKPDWRFQISAMSASKRKQVIKQINADDIKLIKQKQKQAIKDKKRKAAMQAKKAKTMKAMKRT
jgi:hypothetical protein